MSKPVKTGVKNTRKNKSALPFRIEFCYKFNLSHTLLSDNRVNVKNIEQQGFQLVEVIDETSQTVVWKAVQRTLERTVILRILKPEAAADADAVSHFLTIARKFAHVKSESIASIFDIVSQGDLHYVVMEHVAGPTLEALVTACGPLPVEQVLRIAASLIASLEQLWESSHIVHRNLKSATIRLDPRGIAKITDFSLAIVAGPNVNATSMDGGNIVGTPCFLSPEQAQGSHTLNTQSDMYALGAVLYHLATGIVPFERQDVVSILSAHVKQQIPPPHHLNKEVPRSFSWFIHRLMMKNPNNRYADWQLVLQDIRKQLMGEEPSCVCPEEEFLSTIESFSDSGPQKAEPGTTGQAPTHIRLNRKEKNEKISAYQSKNIQDEHARHIRQEKLFFELFCWGILSVWLTLVFWFRAVYQILPAHADSAPLSPPPFADAIANLSESPESICVAPDERVPLVAASPAPAVSIAQKPAQPPQDKPVPVMAAVRETPPPPPSGTQEAASASAATAPETAAPLPSGIPVSLATRLAQAFAKSDLQAAKHLVKSDPLLFQEKEALSALLEQMPEPDALVARYLQTQIGKPLIFEHNGKQRTIIPRGVENGIIQIEANGRGAEFPINKLTADEKLRWIDRPGGAAQSATYCLALMHSSRHAEIHARAAACPLLAPVLIEAAALAQAAVATATPDPQ